MRNILTEERTSRGWSRKDVAEKLMISEIFLRKIESGDRNPGRKTMLRFEQLYGKSDRELFPELFQLSDDTKRIIEDRKQEVC